MLLCTRGSHMTAWVLVLTLRVVDSSSACFSAGFLRLVDLCTSEDSPVSSSYLPVGMLRCHNSLRGMPGFYVDLN